MIVRITIDQPHPQFGETAETHECIQFISRESGRLTKPNQP